MELIGECDFCLKDVFQSIDIEKQRGDEFHHRLKEMNHWQLEISIQKLGHRAFPSITVKHFDRLLKGRFNQAISVKWQRKLGYPKPDEVFMTYRLMQGCWTGAKSSLPFLLKVGQRI